MQDTSKTFEFFVPSPELAEAIVKQNQALVREYAKRTTPEIDIGETEDRSLLGGLLRGLQPHRISEAHTRSTQTAQHVIAERLYHYLSSLSETPWALAGGEFPIGEYVTDGMGTMLGLSVYRKEPDSPRGEEIRQLLERLTGEFQHWLVTEQHGTFVTPWLEMHLDASGELRLNLIAEETIDDLGRDKVEEAYSRSATAGGSEYVSHVEQDEVEREGRWETTLEPVISEREIGTVARAIEAGKRAYQEEKRKTLASTEGITRTEEKAN